jgi:putative DNA primase/helicase
MNALQSFRDAIAAAGLTPPSEIIGDGKLHRFSSNGKARDESGWYKFFDDDRPAGAFGCWRASMSVNWKADTKREFSPEERAAWRQRMLQLEAEREAERLQAIKYAAETASKLWAIGREDAAHDYLARKRIPSLGARVLRDTLLVPVRASAKELVGLQRISPDGTKKFIKGTPLTGSYAKVGTPTRDGTVVICEGYATGVSIHMATQHCVVVAFNAGNLAAVSQKIVAALPDARVVIAADDDAFTAGNPGITAARATGLPIVVPVWSGERGRGTDFNDLHVAEGIEAVAACFLRPDTLLEPGSVSDKRTVKPDSDSNNAGSSDAEAHPPPAVAAVHQQPGSLVWRPEPGSDVIPDYHDWLPDVNDKGKPLSTIENVAEVCRRLGITVRYNVISKEEEILIPRAAFSLDNKQNASLAWLLSECAKFRMPVDRVPDFITYLADRNLYNPVAQWIDSVPWDGRDRLTDLIATVTAVGEARDPRVGLMKRAFITRWMVSAIAGAYRPTGVSAHGVLVFQGAQYVGKTRWFKELVPGHLGLLKDGMLLRPDDRDSVMKCVSNWLVELGEIDATFRKSDVAALKSFLTSDRDVLRRAYARKESAFARRTVFFASVNPKNYLHDETGNRRYWTIECEALNHSHGIDMQQCWAQVHAMWAAGESWFLQPEEMELLNEHNKDFEVIDPIEDLITNGLDWNSPDHYWNWRTATDVLMKLGRQQPTKSEVTKAGTIVRGLNGGRSKRITAARLLYVPDTLMTPLR